MSRSAPGVFALPEHRLSTTVYDGAGNARVTTFLYDLAGREVESIAPLNRRTTLAYDPVGNQVLKITPRGDAITMVYDLKNQRIRELFPDGRRYTTTYDPVGNRTVVADHTGTYTTTYDARNSPLTVGNPDGKLIQYTYDALALRQTMTDPDDGVFNYTHDAKRRLTQVLNPLDETTSFTFDAADRLLLKELDNGTVASHTYDAADRLTRLANLRSDSTTINSFDYSYDRAGNRIGVLEADGSTVSWTYDKKYQLRGERRIEAGAMSWSALTVEQWQQLTVDEWSALLVNGVGARYHTTYGYDCVDNRLVKEDSGELGKATVSGTVSLGYHSAKRS